jgi:tRNA nucleotidyltransferase (CCA-adding enzyme)
MGVERAFELIEIQKADVRGQHPDKLDRVENLDSIRIRLQELVDEGACFSLKDLAVNGDDLKSLGYTANKRLGDTLNDLLDQVMSGKLANERATLTRYAYEHR